MQTQLTPDIIDTVAGREADRILRTCVHCGFCTATCPTYQILGDELDSPRGRIYLIKQVLEGHPTTRHTQTHLDRCLTCRSCETTCPSGVDYIHLLDYGRDKVDQQVRRPWWQRGQRSLLRYFLPEPRRFNPILRLGQFFRPVLPAVIKKQVPPRVTVLPWPDKPHARRMILPGGCVQPSLAPEIDTATARVLDQLGIQLIQAGGCCGAVSHHLSATEQAKDYARRNIDAWWPHIEAGVEAIVSNTSGCGVMLKDYAHLLSDDPAYADKAERIAGLSRDIVEVLEAEDIGSLKPIAANKRISFHSPCTLQHGQSLAGRVEALLRRAGYDLLPVRDAHLCCGSAGTYSITQPQLSRQLRDNKLVALNQDSPDLITTANIGCLLHLAAASEVSVKHWITLFDTGVENG